MCKSRYIKGCFLVVSMLGLLIFQPGCATPEQTVGLSLGLGALYGAQAPSSEIQQTYYLGVFDPQDQVPPEIYRVRVRGQASFLSRMKFASGWVKADLIDSLGSEMSINWDNGQMAVNKNPDLLSTITTGKRHVLFGPEGCREAPKDHRLVLVMGSNPDDFFSAIDTALGEVTVARKKAMDSDLNQKLFQALSETNSQGRALLEFSKDLEAEKKSG